MDQLGQLRSRAVDSEGQAALICPSLDGSSIDKDLSKWGRNSLLCQMALPHPDLQLQSPLQSPVWLQALMCLSHSSDLKAGLGPDSLSSPTGLPSAHTCQNKNKLTSRQTVISSTPQSRLTMTRKEVHSSCRQGTPRQGHCGQTLAHLSYQLLGINQKMLLEHAKIGQMSATLGPADCKYARS